MKRYLWDRYFGQTPAKCRKCNIAFLDGWKVSVDSREDPIEIYFICHSCAKTKHLERAKTLGSDLKSRL